MCSSGGLAAEEPGQRSERRPVWSHSNAEEKAPEHPELHAGSAQERALETTGPAGKHQQHMDALKKYFTHKRNILHQLLTQCYLDFVKKNVVIKILNLKKLNLKTK